MPGISFFSAVKFPAYAFANACEVESSEVPRAAEMSIANAANSCALVMSPVAVTSFPSDGRNSSSVIPNNFP